MNNRNSKTFHTQLLPLSDIIGDGQFLKLCRAWRAANLHFQLDFHFEVHLPSIHVDSMTSLTFYRRFLILNWSRFDARAILKICFADSIINHMKYRFQLKIPEHLQLLPPLHFYQCIVFSGVAVFDYLLQRYVYNYQSAWAAIKGSAKFPDRV